MSFAKLIITVAFLLCCFAVCAHSCDTPFNPQWDKAILEIIKKNDDTSYSNFGTGFLVGTYDSQCPIILLSNRHILKKRGDLYFRVNLKDTSFKRVDTVFMGLSDSINTKVLYPRDEKLDLAAYLLCHRRSDWDVKYLPKSKFKQIKEVKRGTKVYYLGFPISISIEGHSTPVYRNGVIALDRRFINDDYLIDGMVMQGSSGSPVFDCIGNLVGVIYSHLNYYSNDPRVWDVFGDGIRIDGNIRLNSGLGRIIPIDRVSEFMEEIFPGWKSK